MSATRDEERDRTSTLSATRDEERDRTSTLSATRDEERDRASALSVAQAEQIPPAPFEEEEEEPPITRETIATGFPLAFYSSVVTAIFVIAVTQGLLRAPVAFPVRMGLALVVNIGAAAGLIPAMQVWRVMPVARWLVWGCWAGALAGWLGVLLLAVTGQLL